jgi:serine/threonine-protein kinase
MPSADAPAVESPAPAGRYEIHCEIARGGMGSILKGRDTQLGRDLAIKVLLDSHRDDPVMLQRFIEEAQIGGQLQHPGVVPVHELGRFAGGQPYFTMKLVKGRTLSELLQERRGPEQDRPKFLRIFQQVCQTLAYAHARGVLHRDLKPANIMVGAFGEVQVMDWGLAKVLRRENTGEAPRPDAKEVSVITTVRSGDQEAQSQHGAVMGTLAYMPPEQARGQVAALDTRADVFGLGAILCVILTGQPPYAGDDPARLLCQAALGELVDAHARLDGCGADAELVALAKRCLAPEAGDRPQDAGAVAQEVTTYLESVEQRLHAAEVAEAEARAKAAEERKRRRVTLALAAAMVGLALLVGGGVTWLFWQRAARERELAFQRSHNNQQADVTLANLGQWRQLAQGEGSGLQWAQVRALAKEAEALLEKGVDPDREELLRAQLAAVSEEEKDRRLLAQLDAARLMQTEVDVKQSRFIEELSLPQYRAAFHEYGLDVDRTAVGEVAERIRARPAWVREAVIASLDDWLRMAEEPERAWLRAVVAEAAPEVWRMRSRLVDAVQKKEWRALEDLANQPQVLALPPSTLLSLAPALIDASSGQKADRDKAWEAAVALLRRAQERYPSDFWINHTLAWNLTQLQPPRLDEAIRFYTAALALRQSAGISYNLGNALDRNGEHDAAITAYRKAIALKPDLAGAYSNLGLALHGKGEYDAAIAACHQALALQPDSAPAYNSLGLAHYGKGEYDAAIAAFRQAIALQPDDAGAHYNLGSALDRKGEHDAAITAYRKAIALKPDYAQAHHTLGYALAVKGEYDAAIAAFRQAIALQPDDAGAHCNLGEALRRIGRFAESHAAYQQGHELGSKNPTWRYPSEQWVKEAELLVKLESSLPALLTG